MSAKTLDWGRVNVCLLFCCFRFSITQTHCRRRFTFHTRMYRPIAFVAWISWCFNMCLTLKLFVLSFVHRSHQILATPLVVITDFHELLDLVQWIRIKPWNFRLRNPFSTEKKQQTYTSSRLHCHIWYLHVQKIKNETRKRCTGQVLPSAKYRPKVTSPMNAPSCRRCVATYWKDQTRRSHRQIASFAYIYHKIANISLNCQRI